jgi:hypothetical protein
MEQSALLARAGWTGKKKDGLVGRRKVRQQCGQRSPQQQCQPCVARKMEWA